jgi:hypothetical protein
VKRGAVLAQLEGVQIARLAPLDGQHEIGVGRPRVLAVVLRRTRGRIRVRVIEADDVELATVRVALHARELVGRDEVAVPRGVLARVRRAHDLAYDQPAVGTIAHEEAAALVRVRLRAVGAHRGDVLGAEDDLGEGAHPPVSPVVASS